MRASQAKIAALFITLMAMPGFAQSPVTSAAINGSWELRTSCTNDRGKPGTCLEFKHGTMEFTFNSDGSWRMVANDQRGTRNSGVYEIRKDRLILKNADGNTYQDWRPTLSSDGQSFVVVEKQLIETFTRFTN